MFICGVSAPLSLRGPQALERRISAAVSSSTYLTPNYTLTYLCRCLMYTDLLTLVVDVAVRFYRTVHGSEGQSASLDMYEVFGETITTFRERREAITKAIWKEQIASEGTLDDSVEVDTLSRWLAPQDSTLR